MIPRSSIRRSATALTRCYAEVHHARRLLTQAYLRGPTEPPLINQTVPTYLKSIVSKYGDRNAVISRHQDASLTYHDLDQQSSRLVSNLESLGVSKGDRVVLSLGNNIEHAVLTQAIFKLGAILVPLNPAFTPVQVIAALKHLQAKVFVTGDVTKLPFKKPTSNAALIDQLKKPEHGLSLQHIIRVDNAGREVSSKLNNVLVYDDLVAGKGYCREPDISKLSMDDVVNVQFTSGTTSMPKAACLTHRSILNNGRSIGDRMLLTEKDVIVCPPPLFHCFGCILGYMASVTHGSSIVFPAEAFDPKATLLAVQETQATALYGVPTMFIAELELLSRGEVEKKGFEHLRTGIAAGSSIPTELMRKLHRVLNLRELTICYGMTETSPVSFMTTTDDPMDKRVASVGRLLPHVNAKIVDPTDNKNICQIGERGELAVSGYLAMKEYWNDVEKTSQIMIPDESGEVFIHTGDEAIMDAEGYVTITGRIKDIIIRGGENVHPLDIENALLSHESVVDVSAVGVPDERYGEVVGVFVIKREGSSLSDDDIRHWIRDRLPSHFVPKHIFYVDSFPRTASGKVQRFKLKDDAFKILGTKRE